MSFVSGIVAAALMMSATPSQAVESKQKPEPVLANCLVSIIHEAEVPAQEAGVLVDLNVREGTHVAKDGLLGRIDDSERQLQKQIAMIQHFSAKEQAENDINVRYARAASKVSQAEYDQAVEANEKVSGAFPEAEVRRLLLAWRRADLQIEQSQVEQRVAAHAMRARAAEVKAAELNIGRRQIRSPLEGEVVSVLKHAGEWVTPGQPVLRIVHFQRLRIEGFLGISKCHPADVRGKPVTVRVRVTEKQEAEFQGSVVYVSPLIETGGEYRVWAEVNNRKTREQWLLMPGLTATMTIHIHRPTTISLTGQTPGDTERSLAPGK